MRRGSLGSSYAWRIRRAAHREISRQRRRPAPVRHRPAPSAPSTLPAPLLPAAAALLLLFLLLLLLVVAMLS
ncbi:MULTISPECIES: hypothetical protein [unclassified Synechococcus]|uniref:hypothetical protein n=1 Tax=Synechococcales TaxID=1890424 RepID=UPI001626D814|nr:MULTISPECIES: hypothetical protein [unclassified Synechococcus]